MPLQVMQGMGDRNGLHLDSGDRRVEGVDCEATSPVADAFEGLLSASGRDNAALAQNGDREVCQVPLCIIHSFIMR